MWGDHKGAVVNFKLHDCIQVMAAVDSVKWWTMCRSYAYLVNACQDLASEAADCGYPTIRGWITGGALRRRTGPKFHPTGASTRWE